VVALQPDLKQVAETTIFGNIFGGKMAMVVEDGLFGRIRFVEIAGSLTLQQKIVRYEFHFSSVLP
jgi:hypothetical protein